MENFQQSTIPEVLPYSRFLELFDINRSTADRWRKEGIIKVYSMKRRLYVKYSEVLETLESNLLKPAA